jgi:hypothetical protein
MSDSQLQLPVVVPQVTDAALAARAKAHGMSLAAGATPISWAAACDAAIELLARRGAPFQASDLIREGLVDEPEHPNQWGPRFGAAHRRGVIAPAGVVQSARVTVHQSLCRQWVGAQVQEAAA